MTSLLRHLVESTLFAAAVWLVTLTLRRNRARLRHALWMAASMKFLLPFMLFVTLGSHLVPSRQAPVPPPQLRLAIADSAPPAPFSAVAAPVVRDWRPPVFQFLWLGGSAAILIRWYVRWRAAMIKLRTSSTWRGPALPVPAFSSAALVEPGVFGVFRPVLLLPAGIEVRLSAGQLEAVIAHEMCHVRHRDNLAAAAHMLVEAIFWFHPLVWWLGARLVDERERACDEEVLHKGSDRSAYAESILRVCEFGLDAPIPCVSGISGADLKRRIRDIMTASATRQLEPGKKLLLGSLGVAALAVPLAIGLTHPPKMRAQSPAPLRFDVASVKTSPQPFVVLFPLRSGVRISWTTDLATIFAYAYHLEPWRISGQTAGLGNVYAFEAATDPRATEDQVRLMFQSLLIDRFHLAVHRMTKDVDGYALTVAKKGIQLRALASGEQPPELPKQFGGPEQAAALEGKVLATIPAAGIGALTGRGATLAQLSAALQRVLKVAVIDETSLPGKYYFDFQFAQPNHPDDVIAPDLFSALQDLGLKLEKRKTPVEILVVDHIEKTPTGN